MEQYQTYMRDGKEITRRLVKNNVTHNMSHTRLYSTWKGMRRRCHDKKMKQYRWYGGKGVCVCKEWDYGYGGFENFHSWSMKNGYTDDLTIDRIDSDGNYEPSNCRWISLHDNIMRGVCKSRKPRFQYFAYNKNEKI